MSSKPVQSITPERAASRRNVIRGAAWTTAAVTVVVATPNIAAASNAVAPSATIDGTRVAGVGGKNPPDQYTLTAEINAGSAALPVLQVTLSVDAGSVAWPATVTGGWTRDGGASNTPAASRSYTFSGGNLIANTKATIGAAFTNASNAKNVTVTASFSWTGAPAGSPKAATKILAKP